MSASPERASVSLSRQDWSLHRKGPIDAARHAEKVKEAIKENLADIVAQEPIITSDGHQIVKIPVRSLDHPRFRFDPNGKSGAGTGDGKSKVGDVLGKKPGQGPGSGKGAGNEPGVDYYEAEITVDELAELIFADLGLPGLKPKSQQDLVSESVRFNDLRRSGPMSNLDKKRTVIENIRRNALLGRPPKFKDPKIEDLRFKTWTNDIKPQSKAVVLAMRDVSGSMGEFEKYISRSFYLWMVRFLRQKYKNVEIAFIAHHTQAHEVDEEAFFKLGEGGGTKVSSAYNLALDMIDTRYNPDIWNVYAFHFSDGDNWGEDNGTCFDLAKKLVDKCNLFGYGEIKQNSSGSSSSLMDTLSPIQDDRFSTIEIIDKAGVYPALQHFFRGEKTAEGAVDRR